MNWMMIAMALSLAAACSQSPPQSVDDWVGPTAAESEKFVNGCAKAEARKIDCACAERIAAGRLDRHGYDYLLATFSGDRMARSKSRAQSSMSVGDLARTLQDIKASCPRR